MTVFPGISDATQDVNESHILMRAVTPRLLFEVGWVGPQGGGGGGQKRPRASARRRAAS